MEHQVFSHTLPNGLVLVAERMGHVRSAAVNVLVPAGYAHDPAGRLGVATILSELLARGAGDRDSRQLSLALDGLGVDWDVAPGPLNMRVWGSTLGRNVPATLEIFADILRRPHLPEAELDPAKDLALQDLQGLEDSPQEQVLVELHRRYYPSPLNQDARGRAEDIEALTIDAVKAQYRRHVRPNGAILAVAGDIEWESLKGQVERLFGDWPAGEGVAVKPGPPAPTSGHIGKETQQTQVALAYPSVPVAHADYYPAQAAVGVLSAGMSSRLFTEVREKRGLCYSVSAWHEAFKDRGSMLAYVGSAAHQAQEALDVLVGELRRLADGVTDDEVDRVKAKLKAGQIMKGESTGARAAAIAADWYHLGRVRSFDEIRAAIDGLTPTAVADYAARYPARDLTVVTLGPTALTLPA